MIVARLRKCSRRSLPRRVRGRRGATAIEYGLVLAALAGGMIPLLNSIEDGTGDEYDVVSEKIGQTYYDELPAPPAPNTGGGDAYVATLMPGDDVTPIGDFDLNAGFFVAYETGPTLLTEPLTVFGGTIPAGTTVCSHLVHHSPASGSYNVSDSFEFPGDVLGWIQGSPELDATDDDFGVEGVVYWTGETYRGIEPSPPSLYDSVVQTSSDTIEVYFTTSDVYSDQIRVFSDCAWLVV